MIGGTFTFGGDCWPPRFPSSGSIGRTLVTTSGSDSRLPDGRWRVDQIRVERGGRTLTRLRVSSFGVFVAEVADVDQLAALGVPLDQLIEEDPGQAATPPAE
jgi:hypothetical protein